VLSSMACASAWTSGWPPENIEKWPEARTGAAGCPRLCGNRRLQRRAGCTRERAARQVSLDRYLIRPPTNGE
jgi:hypothetical protein